MALFKVERPQRHIVIALAKNETLEDLAKSKAEEEQYKKDLRAYLRYSTTVKFLNSPALLKILGIIGAIVVATVGVSRIS